MALPAAGLDPTEVPRDDVLVGDRRDAGHPLRVAREPPDGRLPHHTGDAQRRRDEPAASRGRTGVARRRRAGRRSGGGQGQRARWRGRGCRHRAIAQQEPREHGPEDEHHRSRDHRLPAFRPPHATIVREPTPG
ncbi:hypothetical protein NSI01_17890 [Pimelobacter simplex]|nr:hypothetical protein NSI01_17890 [Pimelobacter simplex]